MAQLALLGGDAWLSACGTWRYTLRRELAGGGRRVLFGLLNPSTADAHVPDPTLRKCIGFARRLVDDVAGVDVVNPFAFRTSKPRELLRAYRAGVDVVGPDNAAAVEQLLVDEPLVIVGWGAAPLGLPREPIRDFYEQLRRRALVHCLGRTAAGDPRHPLMLPYASQLRTFAFP